MGGRGALVLLALLAGCASAGRAPASLSIEAVTPDGEPLDRALRRQLGNVSVPVRAVSSSRRPPATIPYELVLSGALPEAPVPGVLRADAGRAYVSLLLGEQVLEVRAVGAGTTHVVFTVDPGTVARSLREVRVHLHADSGDVAAFGPPEGWGYWSARSNWVLEVVDGECEIPQVPPCAGSFLFSSGGYACTVTRVEVTGTPTVDVDIPVARAAPVSGRIDARDAADPSCNIFAIALEGEGEPPPLGLAVTLPADRPTEGAPDTFVIEGGPRGRHLLLARGVGHDAIGWIEVDNARGPVRDLVIPLRSGIAVTLETQRSGLDAPWVRIETEDGLPLFACVVVAGTPETPKLPEGRYVLRHRAHGGAWQSMPFAVAKDPVVVRIP